ncbi:hypothetical protein MTYP_02041 [Methylophilaceae bacterium]|nr:hypothetical protein MTYP_02041 [Methylophilaceae bacterium]
MYRHIITLLLLSCTAINAAAQDVQLRENHPDRHIVVKGDTLWDISARFLKDPWLWPKVWKMNRAQIKNPHLIYPGDVVMLDLSNGDPQLRLLRETVTLQPGIREEALEKEAVPTIAPNIIAPFLTQPLIIENDELDNAAIIIGSKDNRVTIGPGTKVYVDQLTEDRGRFWSVYRNGKTLTDPITREPLGIEAIYLADARVLQYGEPATAEITRANQEVFKEDKLVVAPEELTKSFVPHSPEADIRGHIISVYGSVNEGASNSIITINRGRNDGLEPGHVLAIYREGTLVKNPKFKQAGKENKLKELNVKTEKNEDGLWEVNLDKEREKSPDPSMIKLPNERVGLMMVFRTFDRVSYALIMQAAEPINTLDLVQTP